MSKTAIPNAKRSNLFMVEPEELTMVWDETDARYNKFNLVEIMGEKDSLDPDHLLYDSKINIAVTELQVNNVNALGVELNVVCRKNGDKIEVIDGRQRVKWARYANLKRKKNGEPPLRVPVRLKRGNEKGFLATLISTNEMRCADDMLNLATKANRLVESGYEIEEIAGWFNCTKQTIKNRLALLELSDKVQKACKDQQITVTEALKFRKEDHAKQDEFLKTHIAAEGRRKARADKSIGEGHGAKPKKNKRPKAPKKVEIRTLIEALPQSKTRAALEWAIGDLSTRKAKELIKEL